MAIAARRPAFCQRCGLSRDRLPTTKIKVERDDGYKLTMRVCDPCNKALRKEMARR
jgi:hypothetical protein